MAVWNGDHITEIRDANGQVRSFSSASVLRVPDDSSHCNMLSSVLSDPIL